LDFFCVEVTFVNISADHVTHPLNGFSDAGILYYCVAVVVAPANVVRAVIQLTYPQFGDVE